MRLLSPAKINLYLTISTKRSDGFHNINSLICAVSLFDSLFLNFHKENKTIIVCNNIVIPRTKENLVYKSIDFFLKKIHFFGIHSGFGIKVYIWKKIPIGSGFGGGSSNAASAIILLNKKFGYPFSTSSLVKIAKEVGADVPFFILKKPAIVSGIGDKLKYISLRLPKFVVLVYIGSQISTESIYSSFNIKNKIGLTKESKEISRSDDVGVQEYSENMLNDLEQIVGEFCPSVCTTKKQIFSLCSVSESVSGSGSGVFGLYTDLARANIAAGVLSSLNRKWFVKVVSLLT